MRTGSSVARRGFTLVEIMLALTIFASVMIAIYAVWSSILRSTRVAHAAAAEVQRERVAVHALEQALFSVRMFQANLRHYAFLADTSGDFSALSFVADLPDSFPRSGRYGGQPLRRVTFEVLRDGARGAELVLRQAPLLQEVDVDEEENPLVLLSGVKEFRVEFWGQQSKEWEPAWLYTNQLPKVVRFNLAFGHTPSGGEQPLEHVSRVVQIHSVVVPGAMQVGGAAQSQQGGGMGGAPGDPRNPGAPSPAGGRKGE